MSSWRPVLRLARRDARRHLVRTLLAALLIALPVAALAGFVSVSNPGTPTRDRVLATIPEGAQAVVTATAIPRGGAPFQQIPEGAPGPWMDDFETVPTSTEEIAALLAPGVELSEFWHSPPLAASPDLGLEPGEQQSATAGAERLSGTELERLAMVELREAEPAAFQLLAPKAVAGSLPTTPDEVLISQALADRLGVNPGDVLSFTAPPDSGVRSSDGNAAAAMQDSMRGYRISGISEDTSYTAWAPSGWLSTLVAEKPEGVQGHWLVLGDAPVTWEQAKTLNELQAFVVSRHVLQNYPNSDELYPVPLNANAYLEGTVGLVLVLVVGGMLVLFLVTPALAISAEQSRRTLGLAAAAGAKPRDLRRIILAQGLVIGLLGGVIGAVLGLAAALGFGTWLGSIEAESGIQDQRYGFDIAIANFPWWTLVAGVPIAVILGLIAALGPARTAARMSPVDALRDRRPTQSTRRRPLSLISGLSLLAASLLLGTVTLLTPVPEYPSAADAVQFFSPRTPPPGSGPLSMLVGFAVLAAAGGIALTIHALLPRVGRFGARSRPVWRLALRDTADHPSRTVPAVLGVVFSLLAASYFLVLGASSHADTRVTGATLDWQGTFLVTPQVPISPEFDRALAAGVLEELAEGMPEVTGSHSFEAVARDSSVMLEALPPVGRECPAGEIVHASSARELGAPLRCVNQLSGAGFQGGIRIGSPFSIWFEPLLIDSETLLATRIPDAADAAKVLDAAGVLVGDASLIDGDGMVRIAIGPFSEGGASLVLPEREVQLPALLVRGVGVGFIISPDTAHKLGVDQTDFVGLLAETSEPISLRILHSLWQHDVGELAMIQTPDSGDPLGASADPADQAMRWGPTVLLALVAIAAAAISVLLSATQGRRDATTAYAIGADRGVMTRLGLAKAMAILAIGVPVGMGAGIALGTYQVAWNRRLEASGAWLDTVIAWGTQAWIVVAITAFGLLAALLLTRPPRHLTRRSLD
ncbi:FtsX-like permease family protein [Enteractinococcus helveticum]|uniref:ABC3 transporter permease C-terminal domain-containing protein n=1 Tax=Enteractinococcus helveticum TaxID=1837282 RepID=A0A1B7M302_9MICC|nr:FtsX-like permease family protein [Enteractinococcus helveticum]OAV62974.1 hypothetical protein A6F49_04030 [Enteractinococcus helveticum]